MSISSRIHHPGALPIEGLAELGGRPASLIKRDDGLLVLRVVTGIDSVNLDFLHLLRWTFKYRPELVTKALEEMK